jgi:GNAT superfamily N-acetyltransferase
MRATEFIKEKVNPETAVTGFKDQQQIGQWLIKAEGQTDVYSKRQVNLLHIRLFDTNTNKEVGWADFIVRVRDADGEQYLESMYTRVDPEYRGKGIAKVMYQYANSIGNDIQPSGLQTDMGKGMWKGLSKSVRQPPALPKAEPTPVQKPSMWQRFKKAIA